MDRQRQRDADRDRGDAGQRPSGLGAELRLAQPAQQDRMTARRSSRAVSDRRLGCAAARAPASGRDDALRRQAQHPVGDPLGLRRMGDHQQRGDRGCGPARPAGWSPRRRSADRGCRSARRRGSAPAGAPARARARPAAARRRTARREGCRARSPRPTSASIAPAAVRAAASSAPISSSGSATFCQRCRCGIRWNAWNTKPRLRRRIAASASSSRPRRGARRRMTSPSSALSSPAQQVEQGRLADARLADQHHALAGAHLQRDLAQHPALRIEAPGDVDQFKYRHVRPAGPLRRRPERHALPARRHGVTSRSRWSRSRSRRR